MIIIYHAHNDISSYLTPGFKYDYSHSKINLGENYWKFEIGEKIPFLPFQFINFILEKWFPIGVRNSLLDFISKGKINKFISDNTLMNQIWIMDPKKKVSDILKENKKNDNIKIVDFIRFKVGEGV